MNELRKEDSVIIACMARNGYILICAKASRISHHAIIFQNLGLDCLMALVMDMHRGIPTEFQKQDCGRASDDFLPAGGLETSKRNDAVGRRSDPNNNA
jgi:hypothetical protein